jgi:hypothetical protein
MIRGTVLRMALVFPAVTTGIIILSLIVGHLTPTDMLSVLTSTVPYEYQKVNFALFDLNHQLRVDLSVTLPEAVSQRALSSDGREALIMTRGTDTFYHLYHYDLITDSLQEIRTTYTDTETGEVFQIESLPQWLASDKSLWVYDPENGILYRFDEVRQVWRRIITFPDDFTPSPREFQGSVRIMTSPDETRMAITSTDTIYVFNADGSRLRQYALPVDSIFSYINWSLDGEQLYIYSLSNDDFAVDAFRILDLKSGGINTLTLRLEGYVFTPCADGTTWWSYVDTDLHGQILNTLTGERHDLSLLPELVNQTVEQLLWTPDCAGVIVVIGDPNDIAFPSRMSRRLYFVSREDPQVSLLSESGSILSWIDDSSFLLRETPPNGTTLNYEVTLRETPEKVPINHFVPEGYFLASIGNNPYRLFVYNFGTPTGLWSIDIRTGDLDSYQTENETIGQFYLWHWDR